MTLPPIPPSEPLRLAALKALNILDTEAERDFDDIVELASRICQTPVSLITLIDEDRQWFKANKGFPASETSRDVSFCAHAIHADAPMVVSDARKDQRFSDNPLVTANPGINFYAGIPLHSDTGVPLGTLCVIDHRPRKLTEEQLFLLEALSKQVESLLKLRLKIYEADRLNKALNTEIRERKKLELALIDARKLAEESSKAKEVFLANMSHEIRTPMNAIVGMLGQLAKTPLTTEQQFYLTTVHAAADNLLVIINDILDLSKIEAGKLTIEHIDFALAQVVERAAQVMQHRAEEKGLLLTRSCLDARLWPVLAGDPHRLNQVLLNLLSNAIKFTNQGFVDISCRVVDESEAQQVVQLQVKDSGVGMEEDYQYTLFEKFTQEDGSITRRYGGTGLGMSISKELVELMGGTIAVESQKNRGTTVSVTIPFEKGTNGSLPAQETERVDPALLRGKKILIADDNEMNRLVAATILGHYGALTGEAQHGGEAVERLRQEAFDAVLMDVQMPVMDGLEATALIRQQISSTLPIIALTAFALKGDDEKLLNAGMSDYLSKPFTEDQLLQVLARWLKKAPAGEGEALKLDRPEALYNLDQLRHIARGNEAFVQKMTGLFVEQGVAAVHEMQEAYRAGDFERVSGVAHRLKPSTDTLNIHSIQEALQEIELSAPTYGTSPRLEALIGHVADVVLRVAGELQQGRP
jgi:signal transduction histidine kinase/DNA-binding response OmpR family regulator